MLFVKSSDICQFMLWHMGTLTSYIQCVLNRGTMLRPDVKCFISVCVKFYATDTKLRWINREILPFTFLWQISSCIVIYLAKYQNHFIKYCIIPFILLPNYIPCRDLCCMPFYSTSHLSCLFLSSYTLPVKSLDIPSHLMVFHYFFILYILTEGIKTMNEHMELCSKQKSVK